MDPRWNGRDERQRLFSTRLPAIAALLLAALLAGVRPALAAPVVEFHVPAGDASRHPQRVQPPGRPAAAVRLQHRQGARRPRRSRAGTSRAMRCGACWADTGLTFTLVNERTLAVTPAKVRRLEPPPQPAPGRKSPIIKLCHRQACPPTRRTGWKPCGSPERICAARLQSESISMRSTGRLSMRAARRRSRTS